VAKCLVLGANGFIGSHLVDALVARGHEVRAFDRFSSRTLYNDAKSVEQFSGDFLNKADLTESLRGMEYVFHFISTTTPATAENDPLIDVETNIRMSIELFSACVETKVKRVLFASTGGAIYGGNGEQPHLETDLPLPVSPYAIGKLTIEHYLRYFKVKHGLDSVTFRISNPYGERQPLHRKQGVIPIFLENMLRNNPITILGDGSMVRDYIYIKDVAAMIATMFDKDVQENVYNLGSGKGVTVQELAAAAEGATGMRAKVQYQPTPSTFVQRVILNTDRFENEFGCKPETSLEEGLSATVAYIQHELAHERE